MHIIWVQNKDETIPDAMRALSQTEVRCVGQKTKKPAFQAWLRLRNSNLRVLGWSKEVLVDRMRVWAVLFDGPDDMPERSTMIDVNMGLPYVTILRVARRLPCATRASFCAASAERVAGTP